MSTLSYQEDQAFKLALSDGESTVRIWQAGTTDMLLLGIHGGMSHSGDYETVGCYFREHGVTTISFDLCGHGSNKLIDIPGFD
ncbi:MAG: alpha/beta hydrolase, partial [Burkholderiaceae bacterium]